MRIVYLDRDDDTFLVSWHTLAACQGERKMNQVVIDEGVVRRLLDIVDAGLVKGLGNQVRGEMCVEAAVCFALGLPHGDNPNCVARSLRLLKIRLNDASWSSNEARAKGLRRLAVAQLGSAGIDEVEFVRRLATLAIQKSVPEALRAAARIQRDEKHRAALLDLAALCENAPTRENALKAKSAADAAAHAAAAHAAAAHAAAAHAHADAAHAADAAAYAAAYAADAAAYAAARDKSLASFCEAVVQTLIDMNAPGCQWLPLTEAAP